MAQRLIDSVVRRISTGAESDRLERLVSREWLVTNGLGGYASGTIPGIATRRYHGLLVAALPNPLGRHVMLNHLTEDLRLPSGDAIRLSGQELAGDGLNVPAASMLAEFRLEAGLPVWSFAVAEGVLERRILMPHRQNTVHVSYELRGGAPLSLELRPALHFRAYEAPVNLPLPGSYRLTMSEGHYQATASPALPPLRFQLHGAPAAFTAEEELLSELLYRLEASRGYEREGALWSPGCFRVELAPGQRVTLVASAEPLEVMTALSPEQALQAERERRRRLLARAPAHLRRGAAAELVLAADQFVIVPAGRPADAARARAVGDEIRTIIAGYHWFTDWGRDTMIALEGLTLVTGRHIEAASILRTFAHYVRDGLIPNMFPDGSDEGLYHTADASLWFFHAVDRYLAMAADEATLPILLPVLLDILDRHRAGTRFGIGMDPADGLLTQGAEGYQLTWMDAKVDGWVVTPRRGKAVEINALWYNALRLAADWVGAERGEQEARPLRALAAQVRESFNRRFWYEAGGHLYDVVDGPAGDSIDFRPNQLLALSLRHPVLEERRWKPVVDAVEARLLTPMGLRSLAPGSAEYKRQYFGDVRTRDAAYHQGTVWGWLIGPWVDAWLRVYPGRAHEARRFLEGLVAHLDDFGVGSVAEIFDAEAPFTPRGCVAQAWSVAELLRGWDKTETSDE
jgi:predicted glycogen debranching enzyme